VNRVEAALLARFRADPDNDRLRVLAGLAGQDRDLAVEQGEVNKAARLNMIACCAAQVRDERRQLDRDVESSFSTVVWTDLPGESDTD
jgi:hypothetical protein